MKTLVTIFALLAFSTFLLVPDQEEQIDRNQTYTDLAGNEYSFTQLQDLYKSAEGMLSGQFNTSGPFSKNGTGIKPHTLFQFESGFTTYRGDYPSYRDGGQDWNVAFFDWDDDPKTQLDMMEKESRYVLFIPEAFDAQKAICFKESKDLLKVMNTWTKRGVYDEEDIDRLTQDADWIVTAVLADEVCAESYPCQHHWDFKVLERNKGEGIPDTITIHGSYRGHQEKPFALKSMQGKFTLFLKQNADRDTDVIAKLPIKK